MDLFSGSGPKPTRKLGSPGPEQLETKGRDAALDVLADKRADLIEIARDVAIRLARRRHRVTSVEVFAALRAQGYDKSLDAADPRWMGVVFREPIWERQGFETTGSHRRPVAIWKLVDPQNIPVSPRERVYRLISAVRDKGITRSSLVLSSGLTGGQVKKILGQLERGNRAVKLDESERVARYVLPEHHPEIV
jgi:hypothetical protein